jgi:hypothetical protein
MSPESENNPSLPLNPAPEHPAFIRQFQDAGWTFHTSAAATRQKPATSEASSGLNCGKNGEILRATPPRSQKKTALRRFGHRAVQVDALQEVLAVNL